MLVPLLGGLVGAHFRVAARQGPLDALASGNLARSPNHTTRDSRYPPGPKHSMTQDVTVPQPPHFSSHPESRASRKPLVVSILSTSSTPAH